MTDPSASGPAPAGSLGAPVAWSDEPLELGEGGRWIDGSLLLVDLLAGRLLRASGDRPGPLDELLRLPCPLGAVAPVRDAPGSWLAVAGDGIARLDAAGTLDWITRPESANPVPTRMNDGVADPSGRLWAGSMAWDGQGEAGSLYRLGGGGAAEPVLERVGITNGPAFDPNGRLMYVADTAAGHVYRCGVDPATGAVTSGTDRSSPFISFDRATGAGPDGMTVDADGGLWVAVWGTSSVHRYRPDGRPDRVIELPARQPSSVCLGGPDGRRLFVTTATYGLSDPSAGDGLVYAVDVEVPGPPAAAVIWPVGT